jgi:RNA-binding protein
MLQCRHSKLGLPTMAIGQTKIKQLRTIGHRLKPVVTVSENGLTEGVLGELERALNDHELIKVKFSFENREAKKEAIEEALKKTGAEKIQIIGKMALIFRVAKTTNKKLSNLHRPV